MRSLVLSLAVAAVLAACGGGGGDSPTVAQPNNGASPTVASGPTPTPTPTPTSGPQGATSGPQGATSGPQGASAGNPAPPPAPVAGIAPAGPASPTVAQPNNGPTIPQQVGAGAPPVNCGASSPDLCPPGSMWTGVPDTGNCGSQACPTGPNVTPTQPGTPAPMHRPDVRIASLDEIVAWNERCGNDDCRIHLPAPTGHTLTWWGIDPRTIERVNETCTDQPACRVPDGDLLLWNFACAPQPTCRVALFRQY